MEEFQKARDKAQKKLKIADHILTQTYPLVNDPKLLVAVMENLFLALTNTLGAILYYERTFKRVPPFVDNFENKFRIFKDKCTPRYNFDRRYIRLIEDIKESVMAHRASPVEFAREGNFVICSDNYKLQTLSVCKIKQQIQLTKTFLKEANAIIRKNERIFR